MRKKKPPPLPADYVFSAPEGLPSEAYEQLREAHCWLHARSVARRGLIDAVLACRQPLPRRIEAAVRRLQVAERDFVDYDKRLRAGASPVVMLLAGGRYG